MAERLTLDASPLILLGRVGRLELLRALAEHVLVPQAVVEELQAGVGRDALASILGSTPWVTTVPNKPVPDVIAGWDESDDSERSVPGRDYLDRCPVAARLVAVIKAVADAPPPAFSGGGKWEAMHGEMAGYCEARVDGPQRRHYRLFCFLEREGERLGLGGPSLVIIAGMDKPFRSTFSHSDYARILRLGDEYRRRNPRSVAR